MPTSWPAASLYFGAIALWIAYFATGQTAFLIAAVVAFVAQLVIRARPGKAGSCALPQPDAPNHSRNATD
ncbi:MAG TPA: hypothetical protein VLT16_15515 [Candidatus Limnocylindrales bacterium]|nr:hypothetical protein [Candidatus Limnocylindrales bacterium]